jgi:hypothetical protein
MREPPPAAGAQASHPQASDPALQPRGALRLQHQQVAAANLSHLSRHQLQEMAHRQQQQIEAHQQMLVAKEQRLKYLRQQDFKHHQMAAEYERLRRLREKVSNQRCAKQTLTAS